MALPENLSIREVSQRSGCPPSALRYYEQEGLIAALPRDETASRRYDPRVLDTLEIISALRGVGFGITDIREFLGIKRPGESAAQRLQRARLGIGKLQSQLAERRAALERAETLLAGWLSEVKGAAAEATLASSPLSSGLPVQSAIEPAKLHSHPDEHKD